MFDFSDVAGYGPSPPLGLLGITGDHAVMLEDGTGTPFREVGREAAVHVVGMVVRRCFNSGPSLILPSIGPAEAE